MTARGKSKTSAPVMDSEKTLRDHFAGQIMAGMCTSKFHDGAFEDMARASYRLAEAMLDARDGDISAPHRDPPRRPRQDDVMATILEQCKKVATLQNEVDRLNAELDAPHRRRPEPKQEGNVVYLGDR